MTKDTHQTRSSEEVGRKIDDVKIGGIVWFLIGLSLATIVVFWLMAGLFGLFERREKKAYLGSKPSPFAAERRKLPPEPRLQLAPGNNEQAEGKEPPDLKNDNPLEENKRLRAEEDRTLSSYGWVDEKSGVVRIPIDEAKKLLLRKGLK